VLPDDLSLTCRHLLICQSVWYDPATPDEFSLGRLVVHTHPNPGGYPLRYARLFAFCQVYGTAGEYQFSIKLVRIETNGYDEEYEVEVGLNGEPQEWPSSRPIVVSEEDFVSQFALTLGDVRLASAGVYEFQLFVEGESDTPLARERIQAR
jgi:hypothetical protein